MAEAASSGDKEKNDTPECAVCLQPCVHPAQLPCGHIFCFLCVKGFANQNKKCAMCRQEIPRDFIEQPNLLQSFTHLDPPEEFEGGYQWFYEGRNGWWQYDERTSKELETSYKKGEKTCELLIAGFLYVVDLENMLQLRRNDPSRRRRIKRDHSSVPKKGIAGLRTAEDSCRVSDTELSSGAPVEDRSDNNVPITPSNTPQSPPNGQEVPNRDEELAERISYLRLEATLNLNESVTPHI